MIDIARRRESAAPLGIDYHVADVVTMPMLGKFDLVASAYLLNYASDETSLRQMCQKIAASLETGGEFVYLGANPLFDFDKPNMTKYGATIERVRSIPGGVQTEVTIHVDPPIRFDSYNLDVGIYQQAFRDAGLSHIEWIPLAVPQEAVDHYGVGFWEDLSDNPGLVALRGSRK
jgi:toxoflavin synthase